MVERLPLGIDDGMIRHRLLMEFGVEIMVHATHQGKAAEQDKRGKDKPGIRH